MRPSAARRSARWTIWRRALAMPTVFRRRTYRGGGRARARSRNRLRLHRLPSRGCVVRAGGLEPPQALLPYGFSYQLRLSPPSSPGTALGGGFVVWTIPSPCSGPKTIHRRLGAARLVSTPSHRDGLGEAVSQGLARDCQEQRFPRVWAVLHPGFPPEHSSCTLSPLRLPLSPRPRDPPSISFRVAPWKEEPDEQDYRLSRPRLLRRVRPRKGGAALRRGRSHLCANRRTHARQSGRPAPARQLPACV